MKRCAFALAALLSLAGCPAREEWPTPSPALWHITGPAGESGWLFGTIHALPDGARWRTATLDQAVAQAGTLVVEVGDLNDSGAGSRAFEAVAHSNGLPPLLRRVPAAQRPALAAALKRSGLAESDFTQTESWAAALTISSAQQEGEAKNGVDRALLAHGKPVVPLESFGEQFAMFDRLPEREQADLLHLAIEESAPDQDRALTRAWLEGDLATLQREAESGILADPELREALLLQRNRAWTERVAALLRGRGKPFVAVGAAHMLGPDGLPAQLATRGFTVRRVQ